MRTWTRALAALALSLFLVPLAAPVNADHLEAFFEDTVQPIQDARDVELDALEDAWEDWKDDNPAATHYETIDRVRERNTDNAQVHRTYTRDVVTASREVSEAQDTKRPREPRTPRTPRLPRDVR